MLRILDALQFIQKQFQIGLRYYKQLDTVFNRLTAFTGVLIYDMGLVWVETERHKIQT